MAIFGPAAVVDAVAATRLPSYHAKPSLHDLCPLARQQFFPPLAFSLLSSLFFFFSSLFSPLSFLFSLLFMEHASPVTSFVARHASSRIRPCFSSRLLSHLSTHRPKALRLLRSLPGAKSAPRSALKHCACHQTPRIARKRRACHEI